MIYLDPTYTPEERAKDLLSRMSIEEKFAQTQCDFLERVNQESIWPYGLGHVSCLAASIWENRQMMVDRIREAQEYVMGQSEHHIPAIFHIETATGVLMPEASVFPNELARAASWDPALEKQLAEEVGHQARTCGISQGLAPVLDISRDPRMGRQGESYGEDPTLAAAMGTAYVQGLQHGDNPQDGIMACAKHFLGFMSSMGGIHGAKVTAGDRELQEVYGKVFQSAIAKGNLRSVMNCYSAVNGVAAAGNKELLTDLLREEMGFSGIVTADYSSISQIYTVHKLQKSLASAGEMSMAAGMDAELPTVETFNEELLEQFRTGEADPAVLDRAVERILAEKFRLGLFEQPYPQTDEVISAVMRTPEAEELSRRSARESIVMLKNDGVLPLSNILDREQSVSDTGNAGDDLQQSGNTTVELQQLNSIENSETANCCKENKETTNCSTEASRRKIALIGWHGNTTRAFFGCYMNFARQEARLGAQSTMAGTQMAEQTSAEVTDQVYPGSSVKVEHPYTSQLGKDCYPGMKTIYEELCTRYPDCEITYSYGYPFTGNDTSHFAEALEEAEKADVVVVTLGGRYGWTTGCTTGEGIDSMNINLPECQEQFLKELAKLHKPTIGLHFDGRPCSSDAADELDALLECWTPGIYGAEAVVDILSGAYNPSGKLPVSIARNSGQIPVFYAQERGSGISQAPSICFPDYVDGPHAPRYAFGHGLSYSDFVYKDFKVNKTDKTDNTDMADKAYKDNTDMADKDYKEYRVDKDSKDNGDNMDHADRAEYHADERIEVSAVIENTSSVDGTETVQLYVTDEYASIGRPVMELVGFSRVSLAAGKEKTVHFSIHPSQFAFLDRQMKWKIEKGEYTLKIARASDQIEAQLGIRILEDAWIVGREREFYCIGE